MTKKRWRSVLTVAGMAVLVSYLVADWWRPHLETSTPNLKRGQTAEFLFRANGWRHFTLNFDVPEAGKYMPFLLIRRRDRTLPELQEGGIRMEWSTYKKSWAASWQFTRPGPYSAEVDFESRIYQVSFDVTECRAPDMAQ